MPQILRDGEQQEHDIELHPNDLLVPVHTYDRLPHYVIYAGGWVGGYPRQNKP